MRRALGLSQEEFTLRYHIPVDTLRDWEHGRFEPDTAAKAYLAIIAHEPEIVRRALEAPVPGVRCERNHLETETLNIEPACFTGWASRCRSYPFAEKLIVNSSCLRFRSSLQRWKDGR